MYYYKVCISNGQEFTYHADCKYDILSEVFVFVKGKKHNGIILQECEKPEFKTIEILEKTNKFLTKTQFDFAKFICEYYGVRLGKTLDIFELSNNLTQEITHNHQNQTTQINTNINLSKYQLNAYNFCLQNPISLLFGDTGSGKSEIYFKLIEKTINEGKQVLFLMPEIALTLNMQKRVKEHFESIFGLWHSKMNKTQKEKTLNDLLNGSLKLILGARSALFLPFSNIGLIIVDEEHDGSYKSSKTPFYNAKDLAVFYAQKNNAKIVLGSATPLFASFHKYPHFRLKGTYFKSQKQYIFNQEEYGLNDNILNEIEKSLQNKKQIIVFTPNRANFRQLECKDCLERVFCPFCDIALSVHLHQNALKCHYCGYQTHILNTCPNCKGTMLEAKKIGTAQIQSVLESHFKNYKIARLDSDVAMSKKRLSQILDDFNAHKIDILIGTQMISKGHNYLNVDLAVILGLDEYLFYPNYLAREQTLSLALQIAGRAGRSGDARVLIQTHNPLFFEKYLSNYDDFLKDEFEQRADYPPFCRLLYINISHKNEKKTIEILEKILNAIRFYDGNKIKIVGYGKCGVYFINGHFRQQILIKSKNYKTLSKIALFCNEIQGVKADIDPINFM